MFGAFLATVLRQVSAGHQIPQQTRSLYKMTYYTQVQWENKRTLFNMSDSGKLTSEIVYNPDFAISLQKGNRAFRLPILSYKYVSSYFSYTNKQ